MEDNTVRLATIIAARSLGMTQVHIPLVLRSSTMRRPLVIRQLQPQALAVWLPSATHWSLHRGLGSRALDYPPPSPNKEYHLIRTPTLSEVSLAIYQELSKLQLNLIKVKVLIQRDWNSSYSSFLQRFLAQQDASLRVLRLDLGPTFTSFPSGLPSEPLVILPILPNLVTLYLDFGNR